MEKMIIGSLACRLLQEGLPFNLTSTEKEVSLISADISISITSSYSFSIIDIYGGDIIETIAVSIDAVIEILKYFNNFTCNIEMVQVYL